MIADGFTVEEMLVFADAAIEVSRLRCHGQPHAKAQAKQDAAWARMVRARRERERLAEADRRAA